MTFVEAKHLRPGELFQTPTGPALLVEKSPRIYAGVLYNLETLEHVYCVGANGVLVHNTCVNGPYPDPVRHYDNGKPHLDHIRSRALGGVDEPRNLQWLAAETNMRKGGFEGELARYERSLIEAGMRPRAARAVIEDEIRSLGVSPPPRPVDPDFLDGLIEMPW